MLQALLSSEGYDVKCARDGREALESVAHELPDLILLDLDMPRVSGFEVCRRLRGNMRTTFNTLAGFMQNAGK